MPAVVSVFGVDPLRIGGTETFARELSLQLSATDRHSVLCFLSKPTEQVESFLQLPNVTLEVLSDSADFSFAATRNLRKILKRYKPEVLHLHFTGFLGAYPWLARLESVRKVFFTDHTSRPAGYVIERAPRWKRLLVRAINRQLTKVICVSEYGYRCITGLGLLPDDRYDLVYNGVDLTRVRPDPDLAVEFRRRFSIPADRTIVLQVSWIIPEKGIPELLQAAKLVLAKTDKVQFVLVGEGAFREQYMKEACELGLGDHFTWTGMVQDPFGEGVYDAADIVCQLSHWEEVFGWMIAEAMAYQKPIVATRVGGIPELVNGPVSGFLVERGDVVTTAEKILLLAGKPELRRQMGLEGSKITGEKFALKRNVAQLIDLYKLK
jgi:glycosyltransferase involved in cell wall biosynthesis